MATKTINTLSALRKLIGSPNVYVRWSRGQTLDIRQGNSRDYASGGRHNGLSAVSVTADWLGYSDEELASRVTEYRFLRIKDRRIGCYLYLAERVGTDSDGYATISNISKAWRLSEPLITTLISLASDWHKARGYY